MKTALKLIGLATLVGFIIIMFVCMFVDPDGPKSVEMKETTGLVTSIEKGETPDTIIIHVDTPYGAFTKTAGTATSIKCGETYKCGVEVKTYKDRIKLGKNNSMFERVK